MICRKNSYCNNVPPSLFHLHRRRLLPHPFSAAAAPSSSDVAIPSSTPRRRKPHRPLLPPFIVLTGRVILKFYTSLTHLLSREIRNLPNSTPFNLTPPFINSLTFSPWLHFTVRDWRRLEFPDIHVSIPTTRHPPHKTLLCSLDRRKRPPCAAACRRRWPCPMGRSPSAVNGRWPPNPNRRRRRSSWAHPLRP